MKQVERSVSYNEHRPRRPPPDLPSLLLHGRIVYIGMPVTTLTLLFVLLDYSIPDLLKLKIKKVETGSGHSVQNIVYGVVDSVCISHALNNLLLTHILPS